MLFGISRACLRITLCLLLAATTSSCISIDAETPVPLVVSEESAEALQNVDPSSLDSTNDALGEASEFAVRYCGYRNVKKVHVELGSNGENLKASVECFLKAMEETSAD